MVIFDGFCDGFSHRFQSREVNHRLDVVFLKNAVHRVTVKDVRLIEWEILAGDGFDAFERFGLGIGEVVHYYNFISCLLQHDACVRADKARAACYQNCHL